MYNKYKDVEKHKIIEFSLQSINARIHHSLIYEMTGLDYYRENNAEILNAKNLLINDLRTLSCVRVRSTETSYRIEFTHGDFIRHVMGGHIDVIIPSFVKIYISKPRRINNVWLYVNYTHWCPIELCKSVLFKEAEQIIRSDYE